MNSRRAFLLFGAAAALAPSLLMWGFTVDDALISLRYARHFGAGLGWRFNPDGPVSDGVTPLPWVPLLALFVDGLVGAKIFGVFAWTVAGGFLGARLERSGPRVAGIALAFVALCFPVGAWAASGMETGLATALATGAACAAFGSSRWRAAVLAGLAASLRPELTPWACTLAGLSARGPRGRIGAALLAFAPFAVCTVIRIVAFGRPAPLAVDAKPSDLSHGLTYAGAAFVVTLLPLLAFAPLALRRAPPAARSIAIAFVVHLVVVVAVGGDWMPYARLVVPVVPSLALAFAETVPLAHRASTVGRIAVVSLLGLYLAWKTAPAGRHVTRDRLALIASARPVLARSKTVAALDVGWVGIAAPEANIVDLAGLTDPKIAALPGGHTSKRVDASMLLERNVDTVVVYSQVRGVEGRILGSDLFNDRYLRVAELPLNATSRYAVYVLQKPAD